MNPSTKGATNDRDQRHDCNDDLREGDPLIVAAVVAAVIVSGPIQQASVIPSEHRAFAACVSHRESHGSPTALGDESTAAGKYQFLRPWQQSLPFMVAGRLVRFGMPKPQARHLRVKLQRTPINHWSEQMQDIGFVAVVTASSNGWRHWWLQGSRCNSLAVT